MAVKNGTYKGHYTITLHQEDDPAARYGFTFGLAKAVLILQHIDEISAFIGEFGTSEQIEAATAVANKMARRFQEPINE